MSSAAIGGSMQRTSPDRTASRYQEPGGRRDDHEITSVKTRDDLIAATRALDRILLWNQYVVPQWGYGKLRTARWNRFGRPDPMPKYGMAAFPAVWWWDADRAGKTGGKRQTQ
jgi:ABC-type oligopeptide transport system substrate-binding subunit